MKKIDYAIVGSGIGGALFALQNKDKNLIVFEKDSNVGGCASTFTRYGYKFNAGATTFVGYENNHLLKEIFDKHSIIPNIKKTSNAIEIIHGDKILSRVQDFETFLAQIEKAYPNKNNRIFWQKIKDIDEKFWEIKNIFFAKHSFENYIKTLLCGVSFLSKFKMDIFASADSFIKQTLGNISKEYQDFIDAQLLITVQQKSSNLPLLFFALGLSYPFHNVYYVNGGMGSLIESLLKDVTVKTKTPVNYIEKLPSSYMVHTKDEVYEAKNVVLNTTIFDSKKLFDDPQIKKYYDGFRFNDQSAFTIYFKLHTKKEFFHHYQIILDELIPHTISNSFFVSFSDKDDAMMSKDGYSVTISFHTKALFWLDLEKHDYKNKKQEVVDFVLKNLEEKLAINKNDIQYLSSGTSKTFLSYIARANCGGVSSSFSSIGTLCGVVTPFNGLYQVGDTVLGAQGWPGVALGSEMLHRIING